MPNQRKNTFYVHLKILSDYLQKEFGMHANETTVAFYDGVHISGTNEELA